MPTGSWKNHEKLVAEYFNGTRMSRSNYGIDAPDVLVPETIAINTIGFKGDCIIECKYSIKMVWHKLILDTLDDDKYLIVEAGDLIAFDMHKTKQVVPAIISNNNLDSIRIDKEIPGYINDWITQSESYSSYVKSKSWLPMLCLGQKSSRKKVIILNKCFLKLKIAPLKSIKRVADLFQ